MFWTFAEPSQLVSGRIALEGAQGHHLARVLRVRPGERGVVAAGGREYAVEVVEVQGSQVTGLVIGDQPAGGEPAIDIRLLQALLPNPDFDAVIEAGTEVGIRRFVAVQAERSVARPTAGRLKRWQAIAGSAAEQSHRGRVPDVVGPLPLASALDQADGSRLLVLHPQASRPLRSQIDARNEAVTLAVGPEGGWSEAELAAFSERGAVAVELGPRILRARLAAVVAAAILVQQQ